MSFKVFLVLWAIHPKPFSCSIVIDRADQDGIYLSDFCPKMTFCAEGAHTMCMYYNPNRVAGPRCSNFKNISMTTTIADKILDMVNEIRGKIAMGQETGQGNVPLPRGYGMFKLKWDNELATFAQVLANTCILRHDLCRATKRFPDPGQLATLVRYTIPDWFPVLHKDHFTEKGLTPAKIEYAAQEAHKTWYKQKQHVTLAMIENLPNWLEQPSRTQGKFFLQLVDGKATHMGCGISAYVEYGYHGKNANEIIFNTIHIVCNFSSQPRKGTAYRMNAITAEELCPPNNKRCIKRYKSKCGCPPDYEEDDRCLCTEPVPVTEASSCAKDKNCKPAVVLLPIFTVEDAPAPHIDQGHEEPSGRQGSLEGATSSEHDEQEQTKVQLLDEGEQDELEDARRKNKKVYSQKSSAETNSLAQSIFGSVPEFTLRNSMADAKPSSGPVIKDVAPRWDFSKTKQVFDKYLDEKRHREPVNPDMLQEHVSDNYLNDEHDQSEHHVSDVFEKQVYDKHLNEIRHREPITPNILQNKDTHDETNTETKESTTTPVSDMSKKLPVKSKYRDVPSVNQNISKIVSKHRFLQNKFRYSGFGNDDELKQHNINGNEVTNETDNRLMNLLDNLEQEVKHVALKGNAKEMFDKKIKKIYETVIGSPNALTSLFKGVRSDDHPKDLKYDHDIGEAVVHAVDSNNNPVDTQIHDIEEIINELHSKDPNSSFKSLYVRPLPRQQNTLRPIVENKVDYVFRNTNDNIKLRKSTNKDSKHNRYRTSKLDHKRGISVGYDMDDVVKSLPLNIQYRNNVKREKYRQVYKQDILKKSPKNLRAKDATGIDLNRIDQHNIRHQENFVPDYEDDVKNKYDYDNKPYDIEHNEKDFDHDYVEDPLSFERRIYYQERLDNLNQNRYMKRDNLQNENIKALMEPANVDENNIRLMRERRHIELPTAETRKHFYSLLQHGKQNLNSDFLRKKLPQLRNLYRKMRRSKKSKKAGLSKKTNHNRHKKQRSSKSSNILH